LVVCGGASIAVVALVAFGRLGVVHGRSVRVYLTTSRARGVISGTTVWLDGVSVGAVRWVHFRAPSVDTAQRLLIALDVVESARAHIRRDTRAAIRGGATQIGAPVVELVGGTTGVPAIEAGDTLQAVSQDQLKGTREHLAIAAQSLPIVLGNLDTVRDQLFAPSGALSTFGNEENARDFRALRVETARLGSRINRAHETRRGTLALAGDSDLEERGRRLVAGTDSLAHASSGPRSELARLRSGSGLLGEVRRVRSQLAAIQARFDARLDSTHTPRGAVAADLSALRHQMAESDTRLRALMRDVAKRPLRYFF